MFSFYCSVVQFIHRTPLIRVIGVYRCVYMGLREAMSHGRFRWRLRDSETWGYWGGGVYLEKEICVEIAREKEMTRRRWI